MKKPIKVTIDRELGNSGDIIVTITDAHGAQRKISCSEESVYGAFAGVRSQLEEVLNEKIEEADPPPAPPSEPTHVGDAS